ncbi:uncharacterized protein zgc:161969 [Osmerus eperlanus]|uniref:uncharacterized protein zgc:161969 n=1 Tax=Osmerus eperlanus TaxID=29151 RepID=UPI002E120C82
MSSPSSVFDNWHYKHHFIFVKDEGKNICVQCNLCKPKINHLSLSKMSTSNLLKHLRRKHADSFDQINSKRPKKGESSKVNSLVLNFILEEVQSVSFLEQPSFRKLVEGLSGRPLAMDRATLIAEVEKAFSNMKARLVGKLNTVQSVCTTADIWTANNRSYFWMTCHWIDESELVRKSAALACARLRGIHTYDSISAMIHEIHSSYNIENKVGTVVRDNGSHLVKAFKDFPVDGYDEDNGDMGIFEDVGTILKGRCEEDVPLFLPSFQKCVCHLMSLIVTEDLLLAVSQSESSQVYYSTMAKCSVLWNKAHHSQLALDTIQDMGNMSSIVLSVFRWSLEYSIMQKIASLTESQLSDVCTQLEMSELQAVELAFLKEYVDVFKPLAFTLDLLQEEQHSFFGLVIPTLLTLKTKLTNKKAFSRFLPDVISAILDAVDTSFQQLFVCPEAKLATATTPQFRLWWLPEAERDDMVKLLVAETAHLAIKQEFLEEFAPINSMECQPIESEEFFCYGPGSESLDDPMAEVKKYLEGSNKSLGCLNEFPRVRKLFLKYNTTLTSSTAVLRLLSHKGKLTLQSNWQTDEYFQRVVTLQYNLKNGL